MQQGSYILTMEAGRSLLLSADARAESTLQTELMEIQDKWRHAHHHLDQQRKALHGLFKVRHNETWTQNTTLLNHFNLAEVTSIDCGHCTVSCNDLNPVSQAVVNRTQFNLIVL